MDTTLYRNIKGRFIEKDNISETTWEWRDDRPIAWKQYNPNDITLIEMAYQNNDHKITILDGRYEIDFKLMVQVNTTTRFHRTVRRITPKFKYGNHYALLWKFEWQYRDVMLSCREGALSVHGFVVDVLFPGGIEGIFELLDESCVDVLVYYLYSRQWLKIHRVEDVKQFLLLNEICERYELFGLVGYICNYIHANITKPNIALEVSKYQGDCTVNDLLRDVAMEVLTILETAKTIPRRMTPKFELSEEMQLQTPKEKIQLLFKNLYEHHLGSDIILYVTDLYEQTEEFHLHKAYLTLFSDLLEENTENVLYHESQVPLSAIKIMIKYYYTGKFQIKHPVDAIFLSAWGDIYCSRDTVLLYSECKSYLSKLSPSDTEDLINTFENYSTHDMIHKILKENEEKQFLTIEQLSGFNNISKHHEILDLVGNSNTQKLETQINKLSSQLSTLQPTTQTLQSELSIMKQEISSLKSDITDIKSLTTTLLKHLQNNQ